MSILCFQIAVLAAQINDSKAECGKLKQLLEDATTSDISHTITIESCPTTELTPTADSVMTDALSNGQFTAPAQQNNNEDLLRDLSLKQPNDEFSGSQAIATGPVMQALIDDQPESRKVVPRAISDDQSEVAQALIADESEMTDVVRQTVKMAADRTVISLYPEEERLALMREIAELKERLSAVANERAVVEDRMREEMVRLRELVREGDVNEVKGGVGGKDVVEQVEGEKGVHQQTVGKQAVCEPTVGDQAIGQQAVGEQAVGDWAIGDWAENEEMEPTKEVENPQVVLS